jgi:hypothetical protein
MKNTHMFRTGRETPKEDVTKMMMAAAGLSIYAL